MKPFTYITIVALLAFTIFSYHQGRAELEQERNPQPVVYSVATLASYQQPPALPDGLSRMLGEREVFIGPQLDDQQLTKFLAAYRIDHVIDLAHESKAERILADRVERFIVEKTGATYWPLNIEGKNNRLNQQALGTIDSLVDTGQPVFIHCLHGIHRAKVAAGRAYARDGYRWETIVDLLGWEPVVNNSTYDRYTNDVWEQVARFQSPVKGSK